MALSFSQSVPFDLRVFHLSSGPPVRQQSWSENGDPLDAGKCLKIVAGVSAEDEDKLRYSMWLKRAKIMYNVEVKCRWIARIPLSLELPDDAVQHEVA